MFGNLFGKKKISEDRLVELYVNSLTNLIDKGFDEVAGFINEDEQFAQSPNITRNEIQWFLYIVFSANLIKVEEFLDEDLAQSVKFKVMDNVVEKFFSEEKEDADELFKIYLSFVSDLYKEHKNIVKTMAIAMFQKYELNKYQQEHFQKLNTPNPKFFKDLCEFLENFLWNWEEFLKTYKIK
jgi:hypothetical protein